MFSLNLYAPQVINVLISILLLIFSLSFISFNVFTVPVEQYSPSLTSIWSNALGFSYFFVSITALSTVVYLNVSESRSVASTSTYSASKNILTFRTRIATVPVSACYLLLCLSSIALKAPSKWILYISVLPQGIPYAYFYLISVEALLSWIPKYQGIGMTFVSISYCISQIVMSQMFSIAISALGIVNALITTSIGLFTCCLLCGILLRLPKNSDLQSLRKSEVYPLSMTCRSSKERHKYKYSNQHIEEQKLDVGSETDPVIPWNHMIKKWRLYVYLLIVFLGRTSAGIYNFYFKIGYVLMIDTGTVVDAFQLLSFICLIWTILANVFHEFIKISKGKIITRPVLVSYFVCQSALVLCLMIFSFEDNSAIISLLVISTIIVIMESQSSYSMFLANKMFGDKNGRTAYGIATALAFGPGDAFFTALMSFIESRYSVNGDASPKTFNTFYGFASSCLLLGALLVLAAA